MGLIDYNVAVREQVYKVRRISRPVMAGKTDKYVATGDTLEQRWTGPWAELEAKMHGLAATEDRRLQATLTRLEDGDMSELQAVWTEYTLNDDDAEGGGGTSFEVPGSSRENPSYSMQVTSVQEPLLTHSAYASESGETLTALKMLMDGYKETEIISKDEEGNLRTLGEVLAAADPELVKKIKKGQTHYMAPQVAVTARYKSSSIPATTESMKIASPPGGFGTPSGCNWLFLGAGADVQGEEIWVSETYLLSSPGGWDEEIYG
ncbi:MAG: hypothetical protein IJA81_09135 [Akkermansia sp.]|nr:hypothetical protein [Akkermansia sp.]